MLVSFLIFVICLFLEMNIASICVSAVTQVVTLLKNLSASCLVSDKCLQKVLVLSSAPSSGLATLYIAVITSSIAQEQINLLFKHGLDRDHFLF